MSCIAHRFDNRRTRGRVLCFECYRARFDRPERLRMPVLTFPRVLTERELAHRRQMLVHLGTKDRASSGPLQTA